MGINYGTHQNLIKTKLRTFGENCGHTCLHDELGLGAIRLLCLINVVFPIFS
jgi:hypothetical protein